MRPEDWSLHDLLRSMGLTRTYVGYRYLIRALELIREDPERLELVTKRIYPDVARTFAAKPSNVDGALRTAVRVCWQRGDWALTGRTDPREPPPTVREFLIRLARMDQARRTGQPSPDHHAAHHRATM